MRRWSGEGRAGRAIAVVLLAVPGAATAQAAATPAGTPIVNIAAARDQAGSTASAQASLLVAERLDVSLDDARVNGGGVAVVLHNRGNGREAFALAATLGDGRGEGALLPIAVDDGPAAREQAPVVPAGGAVRVFVPLDPAALSSAGTLLVTARAMTGSGEPGLAFDRQGDGGGAAVVGTTGAAARAQVSLAGLAWRPPLIDIDQAVAAPDGSETPMRGAVVTYTIEARFGSATPRGELADAVPAGTIYRPGTLRLDEAPIADAGRVADGRITVPLGAVAAGARHRLSFQVVIS